MTGGVTGGAALFGFVQLEFGFLLGPNDGRFIVRRAADEPPERILVLTTLGAPERRRLRGRKGRAVEAAEPEPVPTARVTVVRPEPFGERPEAASWLAAVRADGERADAEVEAATGVLRDALRAHRVSRADPYARDVSADQALIVRIGFGGGEAVAEGRFAEAWELPRQRRRTRRSMEAPDERFAALLGARERVLASEELVLRARADLDAGHGRQAALQARIALETLLAELGDRVPASRRAGLEDDRGAAGEAANAALAGELPEPLADALGEIVERMEAALRARRLQSSS